MSKTSGIVALSRRSLLRGAAAAGAAAVAGQALAQDAINDLINAPRRGNWDDQFDAQASRTAAAVGSNSSMLSASNLPYMQQAIAQHQAIVANGGWPTVNAPGALRIGAMDPSIQSLRQRLMISGDLPREAGLSNSYDSYVEGAVKRFQARHGLPEDGVLGEYTVKAMNILLIRPPEPAQHQSRPAAVDVTGDLGQRYVMVNIPVPISKPSKTTVWPSVTPPSSAASIVRPDPDQFQDLRRHLNPYWTAPRSIVEKTSCR